MEFLVHFAAAENLDAVQRAADQLGAAEQLFIDGRAVLEALLEIVEIDDGVDRLECGVVEAALRQTTMQRHLAAFEPEANAAARARLLAFVAFAAGLCHGRSFRRSRAA